MTFTRDLPRVEVVFAMVAGASLWLHGCYNVQETAPLQKTTLTTTTTTEWQASCAVEKSHAKASALAYSAEDLSPMTNDGWKRLSKYEVDGSTFGTDEADLWEHSGECILAFRGSDDAEDAANDLVGVHPISFHGVDGVSSGVKSETEALIEEIHSKGGRELVQHECEKAFVVAGHSLGGAVAQLFAVLVNKQENPLQWSRKVDAVYTLGSMPVATAVLTNGQSADGIFKGRQFFNSFWTPDGVLIVDFAYFLPKDFTAATSSSKFKHINSTKVFLTPGAAGAMKDKYIVSSSEDGVTGKRLKCGAAYYGLLHISKWAGMHSVSGYVSALSECA